MSGSHYSNWFKIKEDTDDPVEIGIEYEFYGETHPTKSFGDQLYLKDEFGVVFEYEGITNDVDYGYEMKTSIYDLKAFKKTISNEILERIKWGINSTKCGIHTNVTRNRYTDPLFLHNKELLRKRGFLGNIRKLSSRKTFRYCDPLDRGYSKYCHALSDRKPKVFEFRIFHATPENLNVSFETTHLLFSNKVANWDQFVNLAFSNPNYDNLTKKILRLKLA